MSRLTLSRQLLLFQTGIVVLVVTAVAAVSLVQGDQAFRRDQTRRLLGTSETVASEGLTRAVATTAGQPDTDGEGAAQEALDARLESEAVAAGASYILFRSVDGGVVLGTYPTDGKDLEVTPQVTRGASWWGTTQRYGGKVLEAQVPVFVGDLVDEGDVRDEREPGDIIGYVVMGRTYPSRVEVLGSALPSVVSLLVLGSAIGVIGSLIVARRVKRQTLGLEPAEIAALVEQREAMLHGVREGVLGVDLEGAVTFVNDEALELLELDEGILGRPAAELGLPLETSAVLVGDVGASDVVVAVGDRLLILNGLPVRVRGRQTGWVTSMRDRTELLEVQHELAEAQAGTDTLRAQVHEFRNRLHAIAGMAELGQVAELSSFVHGVIGSLDARVDAASAQLEDPAVAALVVAKASRAAELGVSFELAAGAVLRRRDDALSADLVTIIGNLVDNAFEAVAAGGAVGLDVREDGTRIVVEVSDDGSGVAVGDRERLFDIGFTTKTGDTRAHGYGLALTRMACARHGGTVTITTDHERTIARAELST